MTSCHKVPRFLVATGILSTLGFAVGFVATRNRCSVPAGRSA